MTTPSTTTTGAPVDAGKRFLTDFVSPHKLKLLQPYFDAVVSGDKTFEVRYHDRDFKVGDVLILKEYAESDHVPNCTHRPIGDNGVWYFTGRQVERVVTYVLPGGEFGIADDYCVLAMKPKDAQQAAPPSATNAPAPVPVEACAGYAELLEYADFSEDWAFYDTAGKEGRDKLYAKWEPRFRQLFTRIGASTGRELFAKTDIVLRRAALAKTTAAQTGHVTTPLCQEASCKL